MTMKERSQAVRLAQALADHVKQTAPSVLPHGIEIALWQFIASVKESP